MSNFQLQDNFKAPYALTVLDKDNNPTSLQAGETVAVTSDSPASLTVAPDASPAPGTIASGFLVGGTTLKVGCIATAQVTKADGTPGLSVAQLLDVVAGAEASISLGLGAPVAQ